MTTVGSYTPAVAASGLAHATCLLRVISGHGAIELLCLLNPPEADIGRHVLDVCFVPIADKRLLWGGYMQKWITFEKELESPDGKRALAYCC